MRHTSAPAPYTLPITLPLPCPIPMSAVPALPMMVRTSAKSTLTSPGFMMISLMPTTPSVWTE